MIAKLVVRYLRVITNHFLESNLFRGVLGFVEDYGRFQIRGLVAMFRLTQGPNERRISNDHH
jgi:hypothetical protein